MLMRTDPFREFDRLAEQVLGTTTRPAAMPMDAWREGEDFVVAFDLPGVNVDSVDIDVERNVLTVKAERPDPVGEDTELIASERPAASSADNSFSATRWTPTVSKRTTTPAS
ncbi:18 kDa antigen [Arthrobacter sp. Hiyo8]|nr:18 kDa antigen [Arthrobacter sp. Hiyo8]